MLTNQNKARLYHKIKRHFIAAIKYAFMLPVKAEGAIMSLGKIIRDSRKAKGITQGDVAEKLGVSVQAVSQWERDATVPGSMNLIELSKILEFDFDAPITPRDMLSYLPDPDFSHFPTNRQPVVAPLVDWSKDPEKWGSFEEERLWSHDDAPKDYLSIHWRPIGDVWALECVGFAMEPTFRRGDIVIIDTGRAPEKGDFVVAKIDKHFESFLAVYHPTGMDARRSPTFELRFLHESERKTVKINSENSGYVVGVVREHRRFYRMS